MQRTVQFVLESAMLYSRFATFLLPWALAMAAASSHAQGPVPEQFLTSLQPAHPRLLLRTADLDALKVAHKRDPALQRMWGQVEEQARVYRDAPALKYELTGPRLLSVSRECLKRVYTLALAWRWTGEASYADAALGNLKTVCAFPDWNPSHFLDTAEMSHAVAIGYDWLYDYLDEAARAAIRAGLIEHGLKEGLKAYTETKPHWIQSAFNWNQVCNSGLLIGALAIAETDPEYARFIVPAAVAGLPHALESYNPDGVWTEGPAYWHYATRYTAAGIAALESALGTSFGLTDYPGLAKTAWFPLLSTGPTGLYLNFADSGQNSRRKPMPTLFWLARRYDLPGVANLEHAILESEPAEAAHLVWYVPPAPVEAAALPLDQVFDSTVPVAVMRSAWNDAEALFVGVKAGYNQVNHGHLDLGNFELDALGNRWARDLGSDNYNLPGYWDKKPGGERWAYYRLNSLSHNVPLIDGQGQDPAGTASIARSGTSDDRSFVLINLSKAYRSLETLMRGVALIDGRRAVLVQDEFHLASPLPVTWGMTTDAEITINGPRSATLVQNGKRLHADILSPENATFIAGSAEQADPQHNNRGVKRLEAHAAANGDRVTVAILLRPAWPDGDATEVPELLPLADW